MNRVPPEEGRRAQRKWLGLAVIHAWSQVVCHDGGKSPFAPSPEPPVPSRALTYRKGSNTQLLSGRKFPVSGHGTTLACPSLSIPLSPGVCNKEIEKWLPEEGCTSSVNVVASHGFGDLNGNQVKTAWSIGKKIRAEVPEREGEASKKGSRMASFSGGA